MLHNREVQMEVDEIKQQIRDIFDPLCQSIGLNGPIEVFPTHTEFLLGYTSDNIGVQVTVDLSSFFIFVLFFKPAKGTIPFGYQDETGKRQKIYLQEALTEMGIDCYKETKHLQSLGGDYQKCKIMADVLAKLIKTNWQKIYLQLPYLFVDA